MAVGASLKVKINDPELVGKEVSVGKNVLVGRDVGIGVFVGRKVLVGNPVTVGTKVEKKNELIKDNKDILLSSALTKCLRWYSCFTRWKLCRNRSNCWHICCSRTNCFCRLNFFTISRQ